MVADEKALAVWKGASESDVKSIGAAFNCQYLALKPEFDVSEFSHLIGQIDSPPLDNLNKLSKYT